VHVFAGVLTAGVIIGFGQLYPMLVDSKVYFNECGPNFPNATCAQQAAKLSNMFNYGATVSLFIQAPSGVFLDFFGPRITALFGLSMFIPGCVLFAFSTIQFDAYLPGFLMIAAGGPMVFISIMSTPNLFPKYISTILMLMNGSYGGGAMVFLVFNQLFYKAHVSLKWLFNIYAAIAGAIALVVLFTWPLKKYKEPAPVVQELETERPKSEKKMSRARVILRDVFNIHYLFLNVFVAVLNLKANFFLSTSDQQLGDINPAKEPEYSIIFGLMLPIVGFVVGPVGLVVDKLGINAGIYFLIFLTTVSSIIGMINNMPAQIVNFLVFSVYFPYIYSLWATFLILRFGYDNYGVLYAGVALTAGIVNLAGTPLADYAAKHNNFFEINLALLVASLVLIIYPISMQIYNVCTKKRQEYEKLPIQD